MGSNLNSAFEPWTISASRVWSMTELSFNFFVGELPTGEAVPPDLEAGTMLTGFTFATGSPEDP